MPLTELMVKQAKPEDKPYMMSDGKGLALEVRPGVSLSFGSWIALGVLSK